MERSFGDAANSHGLKRSRRRGLGSKPSKTCSLRALLWSASGFSHQEIFAENVNLRRVLSRTQLTEDDFKWLRTFAD